MGWKHGSGTCLGLAGSCRLCCPPRKRPLGLSYTSGQSCLPSQGAPARFEAEKISIKGTTCSVEVDPHRRSCSFFKVRPTYPVSVNAGCSRIVASSTLRNREKENTDILRSSSLLKLLTMFPQRRNFIPMSSREECGMWRGC